MVDDRLGMVASPPHRKRWVSILRKVGVALVGFPIVIAGLVMLVTPGPGIPVVIAGLAILSLEYHWARRHADRLRALAAKTVQGISSAARRDPGHR